MVINLIDTPIEIMKTVSAAIRVFLLGRFEITREEFLLRACIIC